MNKDSKPASPIDELKASINRAAERGWTDDEEDEIRQKQKIAHDMIETFVASGSTDSNVLVEVMANIFGALVLLMPPAKGAALIVGFNETMFRRIGLSRKD